METPARTKVASLLIGLFTFVGFLLLIIPGLIVATMYRVYIPVSDPFGACTHDRWSSGGPAEATAIARPQFHSAAS
jgi:hypothetical protein